MRALPILAVFLLIGLLGAGLWFAGRGTGDEVAPDLQRTASEAPATLGDGPSRMVTPADPAGDGTARAVVDAAPTSAPAETAAAASEREDPADARLTGRIVDDAGQPVAGARVRAGDSQDLLALRAVRSPVETQTDARGRFELEVPAGEHEVRVDADTFAPDRRHVSVRPASRQDLGDWELDPGVLLEGIVLDPQRRPVEGATIHRPYQLEQPGLTILTSERGQLVTSTGPDGRFRIASQAVGEYSFLVAHEAFPDASFQGATELPRERVQGIEVVFEPGAEIAGRVVDAPAEELEGLSVRAYPVADRAVVIDFGGEVPTQALRTSDVAEDGSFLLRGLKVDEEYRITTRAPRADLFLDGSRTVPRIETSGARGVELQYSPGGTLAFQVVDGATGEPVTRFEVEAGTRILQPFAGESGRAIEEHAEGQVRFPGLRVDEGERLTLQVHAVGYDDYRMDDIALEGGEVKDLGVLRLRRIPVVRVIAKDAAGAPVVGARVLLSPAEEETPGVRRRSVSMRREVTTDGEDAVVSIDDGSRSGRTDENGVCELSSFPGDTCTLRVSAPAFATYRSERIQLPAVDDYEHHVRLTAGGIVEVTVVDFDGVPVPDATVEHRAPGGDRRALLEDFNPPQRTGQDGVARFEHLEAGEHLFRLDERQKPTGMVFVEHGGDEAPTEGWEVVEVSGGQTFTLALVASPRASLVGRVTEGGEPLAGATLRLLSEDDENGGGMNMLGGGGSSAKAAPDGSYEFPDEPSGTYKLEITHASRAMPTEIEVDLRAGTNRENIDLPVTVVRGRVTDADGAVAGAVVSAKRYEGEGRRQMFMMMTVSSDGGGAMITSGGAPPSTTLTDEDGHYELRGVQPDVEVVVEVSSDDHKKEASDPLRVPAGETHEGLDVELTAAGRITVLATRDGEPTGNQLVRASFIGESDEPVSPEIAVLRGDGKAELKGLHAGPWSIKVSGFDNPNGDGAPEQTIEVIPGETKEALFEL